MARRRDRVKAIDIEENRLKIDEDANNDPNHVPLSQRGAITYNIAIGDNYFFLWERSTDQFESRPEFARRVFVSYEKAISLSSQLDLYDPLRLLAVYSQCR